VDVQSHRVHQRLDWKSFVQGSNCVHTCSRIHGLCRTPPSDRWYVYCRLVVWHASKHHMKKNIENDKHWPVLSRKICQKEQPLCQLFLQQTKQVCRSSKATNWHILCTSLLETLLKKNGGKCQHERQSWLVTYLQESLTALHLMKAPSPATDYSIIACPSSFNPLLLQVKMVLKWCALIRWSVKCIWPLLHM
jgi:hypothetical protein